MSDDDLGIFDRFFRASGFAGTYFWPQPTDNTPAVKSAPALIEPPAQAEQQCRDDDPAVRP